VASFPFFDFEIWEATYNDSSYFNIERDLNTYLEIITVLTFKILKLLSSGRLLTLFFLSLQPSVQKIKEKIWKNNIMRSWETCYVCAQMSALKKNEG